MTRTRAMIERARLLVVENFPLKALSAAVALGLYAFVHGAQDAQRTLMLDVLAIAPPESAKRALMTPLPQLRVTVRGSPAQLDRLRSEDVGPVGIDLRSAKEHVELSPASVHLPPGVWVEQIEPPSLDLKWEAEVDRDVPIQAAITGQPAPGFVVGGVPRVEPPSVRAHGPKSLVEVIQYARLEPFDVSGLSRDGGYTRTLSLDRPPTRVKYESETAAVTVDVTRELVERVFAKSAVQVVGVARFAARPAEVDVKVKGPPEIVRALRAEQIVPVVDLSKLGGLNLAAPGSALAEPKVEIDKCTAEVVPARVTVRW